MSKLSQTPEEQLETYLAALRPIVYIPHFDFLTVDRIIKEHAVGPLGGKEVCRIEEYSEAGGRIHFATKSPMNSGAPMPLEDFLARFNTTQLNSGGKNYLLVLKEVHDRLSEPRVISLLQTLALRTKQAADCPTDAQGRQNCYRVQVVIVDTQLTIPPGLEKLTTVVQIRPPDKKRIEEIIDEVVHKDSLHMDQDFRPELVEAFAGLSEFEIRQILALGLEKDERLDKDDLPLIHEEKRQLICKSGLLELIEPGDADVRGLENLRVFVEDNKGVFQNPGLARKCGVDMPSGVMLVGMPGCGKTLMAKIIAKEFEVPLLKLDVGRLMGKYVGESENNLHHAVAVAEAVAPCVLWIDEIEKAFSGIGEEGGGGSAMTRMFGIFLTWMQEKTTPVYVVATANDIDKLPPEFLRRGRFDELFFVDFPNEEERLEILALHVKRRIGEPADKLDLRKVAACFRDKDHYSGADIESVVKEAVKSWFSRNMKLYGPRNQEMWREFDTDTLLAVAKKSSSSYKSQKDKLDKMKERLEKLHARRAN